MRGSNASTLRCGVCHAAIASDLTHGFEEGHTIGQKPLTSDLIESILGRDLGGLAPRLTHQGHNVKALADLLQVQPTAIRAFPAGRLPPSRTQTLQQKLLAAELPL